MQFNPSNSQLLELFHRHARRKYERPLRDSPNQRNLLAQQLQQWPRRLSRVVGANHKT
jgi:hypothetical protein